jgi:5-hydroxyisourate hydrolase
MITTHILDTAHGRPAGGVDVVLERSVGAEWEALDCGKTDADGRLRTLLSDAGPVPPGVYRLVFETGRYFESRGLPVFHPQVIVVFTAASGEGHYHVPLLVSPFGYTTYRGS